MTHVVTSLAGKLTPRGSYYHVQDMAKQSAVEEKVIGDEYDIKSGLDNSQELGKNW